MITKGVEEVYEGKVVHVRSEIDGMVCDEYERSILISTPHIDEAVRVYKPNQFKVSPEISWVAFGSQPIEVAVEMMNALHLATMLARAF